MLLREYDVRVRIPPPHPSQRNPADGILCPFRMLANAGFPVLELRRERYGNILLGDIAEGEHAPVSGDALEWAQSMLAAGVEADS